jgi:hypothetical protein
MCNKCDKSEMEDLGTTPNGYHLFCKPNGAGGFTYYSSENGCMTRVWDTCITNEDTLLAAILCEHHRKYLEHMKKGGWEPSPAMVLEQMAATGGSFIPNKEK